MMNWFDKAEAEICEEHENGNMTDKEYREAMRDLHREYDEYARQEAEEVYQSYYY